MVWTGHSRSHGARLVLRQPDRERPPLWRALGQAALLHALAVPAVLVLVLVLGWCWCWCWCLRRALARGRCGAARGALPEQLFAEGDELGKADAVVLVAVGLRASFWTQVRPLFLLPWQTGCS